MSEFRYITNNQQSVRVRPMLIIRLLTIGAIYECNKCMKYHPSLCYSWDEIQSLIEGVSYEQVTQKG